MGVFRLFFGFSGRIGRFDFWLGVATLVAVGWLVVVGLWRLGVPKPFASAVGDLAVLSCFLGLAVKRGNDRGHTPFDTLLLVFGVIASSVTLSVADALEAGHIATAAISGVAVALTVVAIVDLGFMLPPPTATPDGSAPAAAPPGAAAQATDRS